MIVIGPPEPLLWLDSWKVQTNTDSLDAVKNKHSSSESAFFRHCVLNHRTNTTNWFISVTIYLKCTSFWKHDSTRIYFMLMIISLRGVVVIWSTQSDPQPLEFSGMFIMSTVRKVAVSNSVFTVMLIFWALQATSVCSFSLNQLILHWGHATWSVIGTQIFITYTLICTKLKGKW